MRKFLTLRNILLFGGAFLAILAFFIAFAAGVNGKYEVGNMSSAGLIMGQRTVSANGHTYTGTNVSMVFGDKRPVLAVIGVILIILGGVLAPVAAIFLKKPWVKWVFVGVAVVILVGAIFVFCLKGSLINAIADAIIDAGDAGSTARSEIIEIYTEAFADMHINAGAIFTGIFAILGALAIGASQFVPDKKF